MARGDAMSGKVVGPIKSLRVGHRTWERVSARVWESVDPYQTADDLLIEAKLIRQKAGWVYRQSGEDRLASSDSVLVAMGRVAQWDIERLASFLVSTDPDEVRVAEAVLEVVR